jgi:hypothetical protein
MPIKIVVRDNLSAPVVFCDHCGKEIARAGDGNYEWQGNPENKNPEDVYFTHKKCSDPFRRTKLDGATWSSMELSVFPLYLSNNLEIDPKKAQETGARMARF